MRARYQAIIERDGKGYIAHAPDLPGANGQGLTPEEAAESLRQAIELILKDKRKDLPGADSP